MTPPINIDGTQVTGASIDGQDVSEITVDGTEVFRPIPDSVVLQADATNYDGSKWVSDIGSNIPDAGGNPTKTSVTANNTTFDVVRFDASNSDFSQTSNLSLSGRQAIIYVRRIRQFQDNFDRHVDGGITDEFTHFHSSKSSNDPHRIVSSNVDVRGGAFDTNFHVFCLEGESSTLRLFEDSTTPFLSGSNGFDSLTGLTLNARADGAEQTDSDIAFVEVLNGHTDVERDDEINRLKTEYNIP